MIELPETYVLSGQLAETVVGKTIQNVEAAAFPHKFAWYSGDPAKYHDLLVGKKVTASYPGTGYTCGGNTEIVCDDMLLIISTPIKYHADSDKLSVKHQLLIEFEDFSSITCTVQMWGAMLCMLKDSINLPDGYKVNKSPTPMDAAFTESYFEEMFAKTNPKLSVKAFLATEQRIPGLGNGVLQDILFNAGLNPRRRLNELPDGAIEVLYKCVKSTMNQMISQGGRDTEKDLYGCYGGYKTILSSRTVKKPCPVCGSEIVREAFLGGNIYYCPVCQPR